MRKLVLAVAALTIVGVVTGVTVAQSAPKSPGVVAKQTLVFTEKQTAFKFIDQAPKAKHQFDLSLADQFVFSSQLLKHGDVQGSLGAHCIVVSKKPATAECEGTAKVPGGKITLQTSIQFTQNVEADIIAITGGTGDFSNVRGYMVSKNSVDRFYIQP